MSLREPHVCIELDQSVVGERLERGRSALEAVSQIKLIHSGAAEE